ncbi:MAG TPA: DUF3467 domain-containing protein [Terriglobales bacterium]|jgi:hypothetical protein
MNDQGKEAAHPTPESTVAEEAATKTKVAFVPHDGRVEEVYANAIDVTWTPYDVRIRFGQFLPVQNPEEPRNWEIDERVAVTVAWAEAKFLRDTLTQVIERCETVNGEIKPAKIPI